jgi:hypothetical protein
MTKQLFIALGLVSVALAATGCEEKVVVKKPAIPVVTETIAVPGAAVIATPPVVTEKVVVAAPAIPVVQEKVVVAAPTVAVPVVQEKVVVKKPAIKEVVVVH